MKRFLSLSIGLLALCAAVYVSCARLAPAPEAAAQTVQDAAKAAVERSLNAHTVTFPADQPPTVTNAGNGRYRVTGRAYGVTARNKPIEFEYACELRQVGRNSWRVEFFDLRAD